MKRIIIWTLISLILLIVAGILDQFRRTRYESREIHPYIFQRLENLPDSCFNELAEKSLSVLWQHKDRMDSLLYSKGIVEYSRNLYKGYLRKEFDRIDRDMLKRFPYDTTYYYAFIEVAQFYLVMKMNDRFKNQMVLKHIFTKYFENADSLKKKNERLFSKRLPEYEAELEKLKWFILFYPTNHLKE